MKPFATADFETDPFAPGRMVKAFLGGWFDGSRVIYFWGPDCALRLWESFQDFDGYIYLHNGGRFDLHFLRPHIPAERIKDTRFINGRLALLSIIGGPTLLDSYSILPVPLEAFGKEEIDYAIFEEGVREKPENKKRILSYFRTDLFSLHAAVGEFIEQYGYGLTLAGRSFAAAKKIEDVTIPTTNGVYDAKYRTFYHGGRCQYFRLGRIPGPATVYDINSAYPYAMLHRHAWGARFEIRDRLPSAKLEQSFIRGVFETRGAFPVSTRDGLTYPVGPYALNLTGWEYLEASRLGLVKLLKLTTVHVPFEVRSFEKYVNHFYTLKEKSTPGSPDYIFAKLMLNSFYGRFALNPREHKETKFLPYGETPELAEGESEVDYGWEPEKIWPDRKHVLWSRKKPAVKWRFFDVAFAASVTGFVRAYLLAALHRVKSPYYCDTDSVICREGTGLELGSKLGQWKIEGEFKPGRFWIAGKKLYAGELRTGGWKTASKGVDLTPEQIIQVAEGGTVEMQFDAPSLSFFSADRFTRRTVRRADLRLNQRQRDDTKGTKTKT